MASLLSRSLVMTMPRAPLSSVVGHRNAPCPVAVAFPLGPNTFFRDGVGRDRTSCFWSYLTVNPLGELQKELPTVRHAEPVPTAAYKRHHFGGVMGRGGAIADKTLR